MRFSRGGAWLHLSVNCLHLYSQLIGSCLQVLIRGLGCDYREEETVGKGELSNGGFQTAVLLLVTEEVSELKVLSPYI